MVQLSKRLDRLEAQRGGYAVAGPPVIFIAEPGGEVMAALFTDGSSTSRHEGESEAAFTARAECYASRHHHKP